MEPNGRKGAESAHLDALAAERRTHPRYLEEVRVRFRDIEGAEPSAWARSHDLSLGGLCLLSKTEVAVGSHLALEIHLDDEPAPVLALGRVLRCEGDGSGGHSAGIQFLWVSEEDRDNLYRLADHFRSKYGAF